MLRVLGSGPHTPTQIFWEHLRGVSLQDSINYQKRAHSRNLSSGARFVKSEKTEVNTCCKVGKYCVIIHYNICPGFLLVN